MHQINIGLNHFSMARKSKKRVLSPYTRPEDIQEERMYSTIHS